jgi:hypothetical protein
MCLFSRLGARLGEKGERSCSDQRGAERGRTWGYRYVSCGAARVARKGQTEKDTDRSRYQLVHGTNSVTSMFPPNSVYLFIDQRDRASRLLSGPSDPRLAHVLPGPILESAAPTQPFFDHLVDRHPASAERRTSHDHLCLCLTSGRAPALGTGRSACLRREIDTGSFT